VYPIEPFDSTNVVTEMETRVSDAQICDGLLTSISISIKECSFQRGLTRP